MQPADPADALLTPLRPPVIFQAATWHRGCARLAAPEDRPASVRRIGRRWTGRPGASGSCSGGHGTEPPPRLEDVRAAAWWWMLEPTIPYDARRDPPARQWSPGSTGHHPPRRPSIGRHLEPPRRPPH